MGIYPIKPLYQIGPSRSIGISLDAEKSSVYTVYVGVELDSISLKAKS